MHRSFAHSAAFLPPDPLTTGLTPTQALHHWALATPQTAAVVYQQDTWSYTQMAQHTAGLMQVLAALGVAHGTVVGLQSPNRYLNLLLVLALEGLRAVPVFLQAQGGNDPAIVARCHMVLAQSVHCLQAQPVMGQRIELTPTWVHNALQANGLRGDTSCLHHNSSSDDAVVLSGTSATTGQRKYLIDRRAAVQQDLGWHARTYLGGPVCHFVSLYDISLGAAYMGSMTALLRGGKAVLSNTQTLLHDLVQHPHSHAAMILRDAHQLSLQQRCVAPEHRLASLRVLGAHLPNAVRTWLEAHLAQRVVNSYSSNETGQVAEVQPDGTAIIYPGVRVRVVDDQLQPLPQGTTGRIAVRSPSMVAGYVGSPELTARHFVDGWFISNDLGYLSGPDKLVVLGRADDMLNLGGIKMPPGPLECELQLLAGVKDVVLLAEPAQLGVGTLVVCVERLPGADAAALALAVRAALAPRFADVVVRVLDALPRTESGKVRRMVLRQQLLQVP